MSVLSALIDAARDPSEVKVSALRAVLAEDVEGVGLFLSGTGADEVIQSLTTAHLPVLAIAEWEAPVQDGSSETARGALPPGHQIAGVRLTARSVDGRAVHLLQEVELPAPPPPTALMLDDALIAALDAAGPSANPMVVAYVGDDGAPRATWRGAVQTHGSTALSVWVRNPKSGILDAIKHRPTVSVLFRDGVTRSHLEMTGRAVAVDNDIDRDAVYRKSPPFDRGIDAGQRGVAVLIHLDSVVGALPGRPIHMRREAPTQSA